MKPRHKTLQRMGLSHGPRIYHRHLSTHPCREKVIVRVELQDGCLQKVTAEKASSTRNLQHAVDCLRVPLDITEADLLRRWKKELARSVQQEAKSNLREDWVEHSCSKYGPEVCKDSSTYRPAEIPKDFSKTISQKTVEPTMQLRTNDGFIKDTSFNRFSSAKALAYFFTSFCGIFGPMASSEVFLNQMVLHNMNKMHPNIFRTMPVDLQVME